jgi:hypothetical protein
MFCVTGGDPMKRFFLVAALLILLSLPVHAVQQSAALSADNLEGTVPVVVSLSEIQQETRDSQPEDFYLLERLMETRLSNSSSSFKADQGQTLNTGSAVSPTAPKLFRSFSGPGASGFEPANPSIAVGPDRVVAVVNRSITMYTKLGQKVYETTLRSFFRTLPDSEVVSILNAKVMYDSYNQHFLVVMEALQPTTKKSWFFFAASKTSNPRGDWAFWKLNMSLNGGAATPFFGDYPGIGLDSQAIYLTANMFNWDFRFQYAKIRVLKKSEVYKFGKVTWHDFFNLTDAAGVKAVSIQPVQSFGATTSEFLVSANPAGGDKLTLWTITNSTQPGISLAKTAISVNAYLPPSPAAQKGGPLKIATGDATPGNAVFRDGFIYTAHTVARTSGTSTVSSIRFYQINTNGTVAQQVTYGAGLTYFYFPAVMVDSRGNVVIAFNGSSGGLFVGTLFTGRKVNAPKNTLEPSAVLQAGLSYYHLTTRTVQWWGEYNGIALDYDDSIWFIGASAKKPDEWTTRIGKVSY